MRMKTEYNMFLKSMEKSAGYFKFQQEMQDLLYDMSQ